MATSNVGGDKYRSFLTPEELKTTQWRAGPPNYDAVNKLFEDGRTKVWEAGSLEEYVQNLIKTWEMEIVHKANPQDCKTFDPKNFVIGINGKRYYTLEEVGKIGGSYQIFLQTSLPPVLRLYNPDNETYDSSQTAFKQVFPRGFAVEILEVYSGPPVIAYKFRHWGYFEGSFKGHAPTGELVELFGTSIVEMNEEKKIVKVEFFYDRGELLAGLIKGKRTSEDHAGDDEANPSGCPFMA
ncbi:pathogenesis-related family protein [Striga hermonthica]|uniref:Pathogenesis-related family protein n=1 Tax=Striga hermonthica TaxID=68872 RepID=A0A9N7RJ65_STRHE|nr:pathogenesis-related family protein [Striga hermonthica]